MLRERIKELRKFKKLSQEHFGAALGTSRDVISNIEYGRSEPKQAFLDLICTIYRVNPEWLMEGIGDMLIPEPPKPDEELEEAAKIFSKLTPPLRRYALQQIKGLLEVQNNEENK